MWDFWSVRCLFHQLCQKFYKKAIGLYMKKAFQVLFLENDLKVVLQWNVNVFDCFAISLNLSNDTQHLSHQKTDLIFYIHKETNSPSSIGEQLPLSNESWSWKLSCNEKVFRESIPAHEKCFINSDASTNLPIKKPLVNIKQLKVEKET